MDTDRNRDNRESMGEGHESPRRRYRRWLFVAAAVVVVLVAVVFLAPYALSSSWGTSAALSIANAQLKGRITVDDIAVSWTGPSTVTGITVFDPGGRAVAEVARVEWEGGAWRAVSSPMHFGRVAAERPVVRLYVEEDGGVSIARALSPRKQRPKEPQPLPELVGRLTASDGSVLLVLPDGRSLEIPRFSAETDLQTLDRIVAHVEAVAPGGGLITAEADLSNLVSDDQIDLSAATGTAALRSDGPVDLEALSAALAAGPGVGGEAQANGTATLAEGTIDVQMSLQATGLRTAGRQGLEPIDVSATARLHVEGQMVDARAEIASEPANFTAEFTYRGDGEAISPNDFAAAVLGGGDVALPQMELQAGGEVDLPRLARAVPSLLAIREDVQLTGGRLTVERLTVRGGPEPTTEGVIRLGELAGRREGRDIRIDPVAISWQAALSEGQGLVVRQIEVDSAFARLSAQGSLGGLHAECSADLAAAQEQLAQVFDFGEMALGGTLTAQLDAEQTGGVGPAADADQTRTISVRSRAQLDSFRFASGESTVALPDASLTEQGRLVLDGTSLATAELENASLQIGEMLTATATGRYDATSAVAEAHIQGSVTEIASLTQWIDAPQVEQLSQCEGSVQFDIRLARAGVEHGVTTEGQASAQRLAANGRPLADGKARATWREVTVGPADRLQVTEATFEGLGASAVVEDLKADLADSPTADGAIKTRVDLAVLAGSLAAVSGREQPSAIAGTLSWAGKLSGVGGEVKLDGGGQVDQLVVGSGERVYREQRLSFEHAATLRREGDVIDVSRVALQSRPLEAQLSGQVRDYRNEMLLHLSGRYAGSWEEIFVLVHELVPATRETIVLAGTSEGQFTVTGPARRLEVRPTYGGVNASTRVGWASGEMEGLPIGAAGLEPVLDNGQLTVPLTEIDASGGKMRLGGVVDLRGDVPVYRLGGRTDVLENVNVNREFAHRALSRFNPIFAELVGIEGQVSLMVHDLELPLGESITTGGRGGGHLDLSRMQVQPGGVLSELLKLGGVTRGEGPAAARVSGVDFVVRDGRIHYDNFVLAFGDFDMKFYGSVGFDNTVDLVVSLPVSAALLERLGVGGDAGRYAHLLEGTRIDLPMVGSRQSPRLDFSKVDIRPLLRRASEGLLKEQAEGLLEGLVRPPDGQAPRARETPRREQAPQVKEPPPAKQAPQVEEPAPQRREQRRQERQLRREQRQEARPRAVEGAEETLPDATDGQGGQ